LPCNSRWQPGIGTGWLRIKRSYIAWLVTDISVEVWCGNEWWIYGFFK
jgi:hypothetical protein